MKAVSGWRKWNCGHKLPEVSLKSAEEGCNHDHKHDGEQDVAPGIVNVLSEGCEPVEADVSERGERCGRPHGAPVEGGGIIEWPGREQAAHALSVVEIPDGEDEKRSDHRAHACQQDLVGAGRPPDARE